MDVIEDLALFLLRDAALKLDGSAALVELVVDHDEGFVAPDDHVGLGLVLGKDSMVEVGNIGLSLVTGTMATTIRAESEASGIPRSISFGGETDVLSRTLKKMHRGGSCYDELMRESHLNLSRSSFN
jgi:hypothetical protein